MTFRTSIQARNPVPPLSITIPTNLVSFAERKKDYVLCPVLCAQCSGKNFHLRICRQIDLQNGSFRIILLKFQG